MPSSIPLFSNQHIFRMPFISGLVHNRRNIKTTWNRYTTFGFKYFGWLLRTVCASPFTLAKKRFATVTSAHRADLNECRVESRHFRDTRDDECCGLVRVMLWCAVLDYNLQWTSREVAPNNKLMIWDRHMCLHMSTQSSQFCLDELDKAHHV